MLTAIVLATGRLICHRCFRIRCGIQNRRWNPNAGISGPTQAVAVRADLFVCDDCNEPIA